jgi:hypothetical protein
MNTRGASALSMGDQRGVDHMVQVRRDAEALLVAPNDFLPGQFVSIAFGGDVFIRASSSSRTSNEPSALR